MPMFVCIEDGLSMTIFEQFDNYAIAVMIVDYEQVVVACDGWGNKAPSAVRVNLAGWFHHGSIAVVCVCLPAARGKWSSALLGLLFSGGQVCSLVDHKFWWLWLSCPCNMGSDCGDAYTAFAM